MESFVYVFHTSESRTMTFHGYIKPECWSQILKPMDDISRITISRVIGEGIFNYNFTWRTNSNVIRSFIGCLARARVDTDAIICLCCSVFDPTWRKGLEQAICSIDGKMRIPLLEIYMEFLPGSLELDMAFHYPSLVIRENFTFYRECPKMEASIHFLLH